MLVPRGNYAARLPELEVISSGSKIFNDYWYARGAELNHYRLEQARYGKIYKGDALLVFVTEKFLPRKQVKADQPDDNSVPILKLNFIKKFTTGLYDYSMMSSTFTPIDYRRFPRSIKVSASSQDWCGHSFFQMNHREGGYQALLRSYFETEGDQNYKIASAWLENEIWNRIRIAPESLPLGEIKIIPGTLSARLRHRKPEVETASASLTGLEKGLAGYTLDYRDSNRQLTIKFTRKFPHEIVAWEETYESPWTDRKKLTTRAVRTDILMTDYWNKNRKIDSYLRKKLGLKM
ncbi:MAG: hypothetical protein ACE5GM_02085 [bacterium]